MASASRPTRYFGIHFQLFRLLGLGWWHHPEENNKNNFPSWYIYYCIFTQLCIVLVFVCLETIDPFIGEKDKDRFMFSLAFVVTHDLTLSKQYIFFTKNAEIQDVTWTLELGMYDYYQNNKKNQATVRLSKKIIGTYIFFGWMTLLNGNISGAIQDHRWKLLVANLSDSSPRPDRTLPQPIYIPWNFDNDSVFVLTLLLETVGLMWTGHILITIDTFIATVIMHMCTQFENLNEAITTAYDRTMAALREGIHHDATNVLKKDSVPSTEERNEIIVESFLSKETIDAALLTTFKKCCRQHQALINCVEKFSKTYSYGFMTQLISSVSAICVVMVQVSEDMSSLKSVSLITTLAFFIAMVLQLAIQCFTGNELTIQAESISDAVMQSKWERCPPEHRRLLLMMMMRAQKPLRLDAAGFTHMNNACFVSIMKAAYSYYAVLSQKKGE